MPNLDQSLRFAICQMDAIAIVPQRIFIHKAPYMLSRANCVPVILSTIVAVPMIMAIMASRMKGIEGKVEN